MRPSLAVITVIALAGQPLPAKELSLYPNLVGLSGSSPKILTFSTCKMIVNTYVGSEPQNDGVAPSAPAFDKESRTKGFWRQPERVAWFLNRREIHRIKSLCYEIDWLAGTPLEAPCLFEGSITFEEG